MESLICTVKSAVPDGSRTACSVFMLSDPAGLVGRVLSQHKDGEKVGEWRVESYEKDLVLERVSGEAELELADYLFGEVVQTEPPPPPRTQFGHFLVFEGKNWKLAAEKKWREKMVDIAAYERVGETTLRGKPHIILKGPDCFAAVRKEVEDAHERSGDGDRVAPEGGTGIAGP